MAIRAGASGSMHLKGILTAPVFIEFRIITIIHRRTKDMMYSEFIELSGKSENYITYNEYAQEIEPIYTSSDFPTKQEFIKFFNDTFEKLVYPIIERNISVLPINEKLSYIYGERVDIDTRIKTIDIKARKLAYQYMKLYLNL